MVPLWVANTWHADESRSLFAFVAEMLDLESSFSVLFLFTTFYKHTAAQSELLLHQGSFCQLSYLTEISQVSGTKGIPIFFFFQV